MKHKILAVDDEEDILTLLEYNLKKAGYGYVSAKDGPEAIELARKEKPDLIILDIMLPSMDGTEVCKVLKADDSTRNIPIIMVTAKGEEIDRIVGLELGADDYVTKPFSPRELVLRIKSVLKRGRADEPKVLRVGQVVIDIDRSVAMSGSEKLDLTPKEYKILLELARARGRVLSREALINKVWGDDTHVVERAVDTHVRRLRKKLGKHGELIETVREFGYKIDKG
jgi:DNA-binding response OmpR family regulator